MQLAAILLRVIADGFVLPIVALAAIAIMRLPKSERWRAIARGTATGMAALFFAGIISLLYQDGQRPFEQLGVAPGAAYLSNPGFPSDHVVFVFTITGVVWAATKQKALSGVLLVLSVAVAAGRVLALVHTPADVVGGVACAAAAVTCFYGRMLFNVRERTP